MAVSDDYQQIVKRKLENVKRILYEEQVQFEKSLTKDELDTIRPVLMNIEKETNHIMEESEIILLSLVEPSVNSYELYEKTLRKVESVQKENLKINRVLEIKKDELDNVAKGKDQIKEEVEDVQKQFQEIDSDCKDIAALSSLLEEKIAIQTELNVEEKALKKSQKLLTMVLTYAMFQKLQNYHKGLFSNLLVSYLVAVTLQDFIGPSDNDFISSSQDFSKEITGLLEDTNDLSKILEENINRIDELEKKFTDKYHAYLELQEFTDILYMMGKVREDLKKKIVVIENTEEKLVTIDEKNKMMIKRIEE